MRSGWTALLTIAGVAGTLGAASLVGPPESVVEEHPEQLEPIVRTTLVCPFVGGEAEGRSHLGVYALPDVPTARSDEQGPITARALDFAPESGETPEPTPTRTKPPKPMLTVENRGRLGVTRAETEEATSVAVEGTGEFASGLAAEQSLLMSEVDLRGLSTSTCGPAKREHWFVGGSGQVGKRDRLIVSNPTPVAAVVDVELWDESGPVEASATQGIGVPARSQKVLLLDALAPESERVGVRVVTSQGRVSAAIEAREADGLTPLGMSFIPATETPQRKVVIPGVPGHGRRVLQILAPGEIDAIVSMRLFGSSGPFAPVDHEVLTVPSGAVFELPLDEMTDEPVAIELSSDEPIAAAVRVVDNPDDGLREVAFTAASPPLSGPAAALIGRSSQGFTSTVHVSSVVETSSRVTVSTLNEDGSVASEEEIDVPPGATIPVEVERPDDTTFATAVVDPAQPGSVVVAREISATNDDGAYLDLMPMWSPVTEVPVPQVVGELPGVLDPNEE